MLQGCERINGVRKKKKKIHFFVIFEIYENFTWGAAHTQTSETTDKEPQVDSVFFCEGFYVVFYKLIICFLYNIVKSTIFPTEM